MIQVSEEMSRKAIKEPQLPSPASYTHRSQTSITLTNLSLFILSKNLNVSTYPTNIFSPFQCSLLHLSLLLPSSSSPGPLQWK